MSDMEQIQERNAQRLASARLLCPEAFAIVDWLVSTSYGDKQAPERMYQAVFDYTATFGPDTIPKEVYDLSVHHEWSNEHE